MRKTIAILMAGVLMLGAIGCGGSSGKASPKAGDPATKNIADSPDATKLPAKRK
jgi:hypothetical protein